MRDLFGDGIFAVDGDKWLHQRKLASYEFSTKVLRGFSSAVFRANAAKLTSKISVAAAAKQAIDMQVFIFLELISLCLFIVNWVISKKYIRETIFKVVLEERVNCSLLEAMKGRRHQA